MTQLTKQKSVTFLYIVLRMLVIAVGIRQFFMGNYKNVLICLLTLFLFMLPSLLSKRLHITLPSLMEIIFIIFIFSAEILGEINRFYTHIPNWDDLLHLVNGFVMTAIGFAILSILMRYEKTQIKLHTVYAIAFAFCFSMTVAVFWEFLEFSMDSLLGMDTQKDTIISSINSMVLQDQPINVPVKLVFDTIVINGEKWNYGGYIDIGLIDTMWDMILNCIGAIAFIIILAISKVEGNFVKNFIPKLNK